VSLALAEVLFDGPHISVADRRFDYGETRQIAFGFINNRLFVCVYADRDGGRRIISLRTRERSGGMAKKLSRAAREALRKTDWRRLDAMTDADIARQIAANADAAPDMAPDIDVRAIREAIGMTQVEFAAAYAFSVRTIQEWERGAKRPSGPARTLLRAIKGDPEGLRKALAAA
jgi:putative transcriptional regulator